MGLYSDQIASRIKYDADNFDESIDRLVSVVMGQKQRAEGFLSERETAKDAIAEILRFFHVMPTELPATIQGVEDQLEFFLRPSGIMRRPVELMGEWYKDGIGPLLGQTKAGQVVALIPGKMSGYTFYDHEKKKRVKVGRANCGQIAVDAYCFYTPLPPGKIGVPDLLLYMARSLAISDYVLIAGATLAATLLGLITPYVNREMFGNVIASGAPMQLFSISSLLLGAAISAMLIGMTRSLIMEKINTKLDISTQSAAMARMLSLPASFFTQYGSGEIAQRMESVNALCSVLAQIVIGAGLSSLFSLIYIGQIAVLAPALAIPALLIILINIALTLLSARLGVKITKKQMEAGAKLSGLVFSLINGIQKIKVAGAERRAFAKWANSYARSAELTFAPPLFMRIGPALISAVSLLGTVILFAIAGLAGISVADYMAFNASFGMVSGAIMSLAGIAVTLSQIKPLLDLAEPIMSAEPEVSTDKKMVSQLSGSIEINNVSFRYTEDMPLVLDDLSLKINRGQYVAVVGASGCGKSTLLRLLLGFEQPQKGAIYYDGRDLKSVDLKSLRQNIGCVIQNGKLMSGSIFENISISAPRLSLEEAWEAAEMAGIADDIRAMPMGMHTMIAEGGGGISGGQRQRLLIARAIAPGPKVLMLDEATSALDNLTQKHVAASLDGLKCTRLVIAHRLSTIRRCDRIIMLEKGKIVEDGTYDALMALNGKFAELVERQKLEG